jgi:CDGSH-type Zn-finger protein
VTREDGTTETLPRATLCRCGDSEHKPFCDNTHIKTAFRAPGVPYKIHLSPVRPHEDRPLARAADPRGFGGR